MEVIYNIEIREGEKVTLLFSPRLYIFKGREGVTFDFDSGNHNELQSVYADIIYCAAVNHWTLTHAGDEVFPYSRLDFHVYSASHPDAFARCILFAMQALSGKSIEDLSNDVKEGQKSQENDKKKGDKGKVKKKNLWSWITSRLRNS